MESDFNDIGYNFLVGGDGAIYVGVANSKIFLSLKLKIIYFSSIY